MRHRRPPGSRSVQKRSERERIAGLDPDDEAAHWLAEHEPQPPPPEPKFKSKELHRWRQRQQRKD